MLFLPQIGMIFECMGMPRFRLGPHYQDQSFHFPTNILRTTAATVKASTARPNKRSDCLGALVSKKLKLALCCRMELQPKNSHQMNRHAYTAYTHNRPVSYIKPIWRYSEAPPPLGIRSKVLVQLSHSTHVFEIYLKLSSLSFQWSTRKITLRVSEAPGLGCTMSTVKKEISYLYV